MKRKQTRKAISKRRIFALSLLLLLIFPVCASAETTVRFLESYETEETKMKIYCSSLTGDGLPAAEQFKVTLGSRDVPVIEVYKAADAGIPITFYCLVDVSGSMKQEQIDQAKGVLTSICQSMKEGDNMVIGTLGNNLTGSGFLSDKNEIQAAINNLQPGHEDTNLYAGVVESIHLLRTDNRANRKKCLVILSDGEDDQKSGITEGEAQQAVKGCGIPVYTVVTLPTSLTEQELGRKADTAKPMRGFSAMSVGGKDYSPVLMLSGPESLTDPAAIGLDMIQRLRNGVIVTVDAAKAAELDRDLLLLRVVYTMAEQSVWEDTLEIYAEDLPEPMIMEEPEPAQETESSVQPAPSKKPEPAAPDYTVPIIVGAAALVLLAVVVIVIVLKKKGREEEGSLEEAEEEPVQTEPEPIQEPKLSEMTQPQNKEPEPSEADSHAPLCEVRFVAIGYEQIHFALQIPEGRIMTLGRDKRSELVLNPQDTHLSGVHCKVRCIGDVMHIWDMDSRNGTFVNGVSVKKMGMATVGKGDIVRLGGYEYRITVRRKETI